MKYFSDTHDVEHRIGQLRRAIELDELSKTENVKILCEFERDVLVRVLGLKNFQEVVDEFWKWCAGASFYTLKDRKPYRP